MIRYPITTAKLEADIEEQKAGWLAHAKMKTAAFRAAKKFNEPDGQNSWSEIKPVFMRLQYNKCAFCDRQLSGLPQGRIEHDVEHFRPKNKVKNWTPRKNFSSRFPLGAATNKGYHLLAYNIFNYATSCKPCNTVLKGNYFPIASQRVMDSDDFEKLRLEMPYLIYPISDFDDDPEDLITYQGILPIPKYRRGHKHQRARVTIDFFALDTRDDLLRLRAEIIRNIWVAFRALENHRINDEDRADAVSIIESAKSPNISQAACARAFYELCHNDAVTARKFKEKAQEILRTN